MKVAIVGSRSINISNIDEYLPSECTEIVSGGAQGVDSSAADYARKSGIKLMLFLPEYQKYGHGAPIVRNKKIVDYADTVIAFWDGKSKGTLSVIKYCERIGKSCKTIVVR